MASTPESDGWRYYWKAILAFVSLLVTNLAASWMESGQAWPADWKEALRWIATTAVGTWVVYQKANAGRPSGRHAKSEPEETATP